LLQAFGDGPAMHGLQDENFENEEIEGSLDEVSGFAHGGRRYR
jgi:hypothetical protein